MRVIAGSAGGLPLTVPPSLTRPTADRAREALFSSLGDRVPGADVLDLYAGSGALGIEALSRGASSAVFVESDEAACGVIRANLARTRLDTPAAVLQRAPVSRFLRQLGEEGAAPAFDLIFADPPYARDEATLSELAALLASPSLSQALRRGGCFVLEASGTVPLPLPPDPIWECRRDRRYGSARLHFLFPAA